MHLCGVTKLFDLNWKILKVCISNPIHSHYIGGWYPSWVWRTPGPSPSGNCSPSSRILGLLTDSVLTATGNQTSCLEDTADALAKMTEPKLCPADMLAVCHFLNTLIFLLPSSRTCGSCLPLRLVSRIGYFGAVDVTAPKQHKSARTSGIQVANPHGQQAIFLGWKCRGTQLLGTSRGRQHWIPAMACYWAQLMVWISKSCFHLANVSGSPVRNRMAGSLQRTWSTWWSGD